MADRSGITSSDLYSRRTWMRRSTALLVIPLARREWR